MADIEKENLVVQRFVWKDEEHKCEAGRLLYALTEMTTNSQHVTSCKDEAVVGYLKDKGIAEVVDDTLHLVEGKMNEAEDLGNKISEHVGKEIESIPTTKKLQMMPSIFMMAVPLPCSQPVEEKKNEE